jgi:hypothetical protein
MPVKVQCREEIECIYLPQNVRMKKPAFALLGLFFLFTGVAQKNFLPGYIVLPGKDTVRGQVDYREWERNPVQVVFTSLSSGSRVYTVREIEAFGIDGIDHYRKATVAIDDNPVTVQDVSGYRQGLTPPQTVFLRILVKGDVVDLYEYVNFKPHYFIAKPGESAEELSYRVIQDSLSASVRVYNDFRIELKKLLASQGLTYEQSMKIDKLDYKAKDLIKFVSEVNGMTGQAGLLQNKKDKSRFFAGGGLVFPNFGFSSGDPRLNSLKFRNDGSYIVTAGIDFFASRSLQNLLLRAEVSFSQLKTTGSGESANTSMANQKNEYSLRQTNITPVISVLYNFIRQQKAKIYGGAGIGYNFSNYPEHVLTTTNGLTGDVGRYEDFPEFEKSWISVYGRLGVTVISKLDIGVTAQIYGSFINYTQTKNTGVPISFRVLYQF